MSPTWEEQIEFYEDFRCTFVSNKFWTVNSIKVPDKLIDKAKFISVYNILNSPGLRERFRPYWHEYGVTGECMLPGEYNYALIDDKYFHLEKTGSAGPIYDESNDTTTEWYYYQIIYDDWANDWLSNKVKLKGTINKTGDIELVKKNIFQIDPLITNPNTFEYINGETSDQNTTLSPVNLTKSTFAPGNGMSVNDFLLIKSAIQNYDKTINYDRLVLPFVYKTGKSSNWKTTLIEGLHTTIKSGLKVFDYNEKLGNKGDIITALNSSDVYTIAGSKTKLFHYASRSNDSKWVPEVDLSKCTDLIELDNVTFRRKYNINEQPPSLNIEEHIVKPIQQKFNLSIDTSELKKIAAEKFITDFNIFTLNPQSKETKLFKNVTVEPIYVELDRSYDDKRWHSYSIFNTTIPFSKFHKNFIFDDEHIEERLITDTSISVETDYWKNKFDTSSYKDFKSNYETAKNTGVLWDQKIGPKKLNLAIIETYKHKLNCNTCNDILNFSNKSTNELKNTVIYTLLPDYDRNVYTLARGIFVDKGPFKNGKRTNLLLIEELENTRSKSTQLDLNSAPDELINEYRKWFTAPDIWTYIVQAPAFKLILNGEYWIRYKTWLSYGLQKQPDFTTFSTQFPTAGISDWTSLDNEWTIPPGYENYYSNLQGAQQVTLPYIYKTSTRKYHIEFTFPERFNNISILDEIEKEIKGKSLEEEVLSYGYIENGKSTPIKGTKYTNVYTYNPSNRQVETTSSIKSKLVYVYINLFENEDQRRNGLVREEARSLAEKLHKLWFEIPWKDNEYAGGIPCSPLVFTDTEGNKYLINTWTKTFNNFFHTAIIKTAPIEEEQWMKGQYSGYPRDIPNDQLFVYIVPNDWYNASNDPNDYFMFPIQHIKNNKLAYIAFISHKENWKWGKKGRTGIHSWYEADMWNKYFNEDIKPYQNHILMEDFIGTVNITTYRDSNPTDLYTSYFNGDEEEIKLTVTENEYPPLLTRYLNLNNTTFLSRQTRTTSNDKDFFNDLLDKLFDDTISQLSSTPHVFELVDTDWIMSIKINKETKKFDYELFTKNRSLIKNLETKKYRFKDNEKSINQLINCTIQFNIFGQDIQIKSRDIKKVGGYLEPELMITPIHDVKQSETAVWYHLEIKGLNQDIIDTIIEVPKEHVITENMNIYDKERLMREIAFNSVEREAELKVHDHNNRKFYMGDEHERELNELTYEKEYWSGHGTTFGGFAAGAVTTGMGLAALTAATGPLGIAVGTVGFGLIAAFGGILSGRTQQYYADEIYKLKEKQRLDRWYLGITELDNKGDLLSKQHEIQRQNDYKQIRALSNNIQFPTLNNKLVFRSFNNQTNRNDIYIKILYPSGKLKEWIDKYYDEYGYNLLSRDFICKGISDIRKHLKFQTIEINEYEGNQAIKKLIENRALKGIFIIPYIPKIDDIKPLSEPKVVTCNYYELNEKIKGLEQQLNVAHDSNSRLQSTISAWLEAAKDMKNKYTVVIGGDGGQDYQTPVSPKDLLTFEEQIAVDIESKKRMLEDYKREIETHKFVLEETSKKVAEQVDQKYASEIIEKKKQLDELEERLKNAQNQLSSEQQSNTRNAAEVEQLKKQLESVRKGLATARSERDEAQKRRDALIREKSEEVEKNKTLTNKLAEAIALAGRCESEKEQLKKAAKINIGDYSGSTNEWTLVDLYKCIKDGGGMNTFINKLINQSIIYTFQPHQESKFIPSYLYYLEWLLKLRNYENDGISIFYNNNSIRNDEMTKRINNVKWRLFNIIYRSIMERSMSDPRVKKLYENLSGNMINIKEGFERGHGKLILKWPDKGKTILDYNLLQTKTTNFTTWEVINAMLNLAKQRFKVKNADYNNYIYSYSDVYYDLEKIGGKLLFYCINEVNKDPRASRYMERNNQITWIGSSYTSVSPYRSQYNYSLMEIAIFILMCYASFSDNTRLTYSINNLTFKDITFANCPLGWNWFGNDATYTWNQIESHYKWLSEGIEPTTW